MSRYNPPTRVVTREIPYLSAVTSADPEWARFKLREAEYEFSKRTFYANPSERGANNSHSNVYDVGLPYGPDDATVVAARPMYSGTPDGKGWA